MDAPFFPYIRREINHGLRGGREKTHGSSPSTSGKTNEKPSEIQTRRRQCTIDCIPFPLKRQGKDNQMYGPVYATLVC